MNILSDVLTTIGFGSKVIGRGTSFEKRISAREVQKAFLENLYFAEYFESQSIWQAINLIKRENRECDFRGVKSSFEAMMEIIRTCFATKGNSRKFNAGILLDKFSSHSAFFTSNEIKNIMVYLGRKAFGRNVGQERNEIQQYPWGEIHREHYMENAQKLGLIFEVKPQLQKYDETWIQGAAYFRTRTRIEYTKKLQDEGFDLGTIRILTGDRELWVEIDKMPGATMEETQNFMLQLAEKSGIKIVGFEERVISDLVRTYPKYAEDESQKLTETVMAKAIYRDVFGRDLIEDEVVDSSAEEGLSRPTTASAAAKVARFQFADRIRRGDFKNKKINILIVSNQPYVERQTITNERAVLKEMKKIGPTKHKLVFDGAGSVCMVGVSEIHSEFGALVSEKYMKQIEDDKFRMIKILKRMNYH
jgi:hypothetical protein